MGEILMVLLGGLLAASFVALGLYAVLGVAFTVSTVRGARRERELLAEIDEAIVAILGPRSSGTSAVPRSQLSTRGDGTP